MNLETIVLIATSTVTALVALLAVIAPLTSTDKDDRVLAVLRWIEAAIAKILLPGRSLGASGGKSLGGGKTPGQP